MLLILFDFGHVCTKWDDFGNERRGAKTQRFY